MFEKASKLKLRFSTPRGQITTEDLWDLPLESVSKVDLYSIGEDLYKKVQELQTSGFRKTHTKASDLAELRLEIVKHIVDAKETESKAKSEAAAKRSKNEAIKAIIAKKEVADLESKSTEELMKLLED